MHVQQVQHLCVPARPLPLGVFLPASKGPQGCGAEAGSLHLLQTRDWNTWNVNSFGLAGELCVTHPSQSVTCWHRTPTSSLPPSLSPVPLLGVPPPFSSSPFPSSGTGKVRCPGAGQWPYACLVFWTQLWDLGLSHPSCNPLPACR